MDTAATEAVAAFLATVFVAVPPLAIAAARATPGQLAEMLTARDSHSA